jgi:hypothetical protein
VFRLNPEIPVASLSNNGISVLIVKVLFTNKLLLFCIELTNIFRLIYLYCGNRFVYFLIMYSLSNTHLRRIPSEPDTDFERLTSV